MERDSSPPTRRPSLATWSVYLAPVCDEASSCRAVSANRVKSHRCPPCPAENHTNYFQVATDKGCNNNSNNNNKVSNLTYAHLHCTSGKLTIALLRKTEKTLDKPTRLFLPLFFCVNSGPLFWSPLFCCVVHHLLILLLHFRLVLDAYFVHDFTMNIFYSSFSSSSFILFWWAELYER